MKKLLTQTTIYFVRHGDVIGRSDFLYGRLPGYPLSERGAAQVRKIGRWLAGQSISQIYTSPLLRTVQTAKIIGEYCLKKPVKNNLLNEWNHPWGGKYRAQIIKTDPVNWRVHLTKPVAQKTGEPVKVVARRMAKFLQIVLKKGQGRNIVVVSHGDPIRYGILTWQKKDLNKIHSMSIDTGSVYQAIFNAKNKIVKLKYLTNIKLKK